MPIIVPNSLSIAAPAHRTPDDLPGLLYRMRTDCTRLMFQDAAGETPGYLNCVDDTDPVGKISDIGSQALTLRAESNARRPQLTSGYGLNSALLFDNLTSPDFLVLKSSTDVFGDAFISKRRFTLFFKIRPTVDDGSSVYLFDSTNAGGSDDFGILVIWLSTHNFRIILCKGIGGSTVVLYNTTATVTASGNAVPVAIMGDGVNLYVRVGDNAVETATLASGLSSPVTMDRELTIGVRGNQPNTTGSSFGGVLADVSIFDRPLGGNEFDFLANYNPPRHNRYPGRLLSERAIVAPRQVSGLHLWFDGADTDTMFEDTAGTTPILEPGDTAFNQTCALWKNKSGFLGADRHASHATLGPTLRAPGFADNGSRHTALFWDGVDDRLDFGQDLGNYYENYVIFVAKNLDSGHGSHFFQGSQYMVVTGTDYPDDPGNQRFVWHPVDGAPPISPVVNRDQDWNIYEAYRIGQTGANACNGVYAAEGNGITVSNLTSMGPENNPDFWLDGTMAEAMWYNLVPPHSIRNKLRRYLADKWDIANVTY